MITPKYPNLMNRGPMNLPQSPEDMLKQLINACDFFSHWFPGQCFGLKAAITELIPDVKSRNWQRAINGIDIKRDILIWQLEQRTDVPGGIKEHQKEGIRWQALALKWLLDEIQLQHRRFLLHGRA